MPALEARRADFDAAGSTVLGISCDSLYSHEAWSQHLGLSYPLLSDIHRTVCRRYGVFNAERNCAQRSVFIVDKAGRLSFQEAYGPGQLPDPEQLLRVLKGLPG